MGNLRISIQLTLGGVITVIKFCSIRAVVYRIYRSANSRLPGSHERSEGREACVVSLTSSIQFCGTESTQISAQRDLGSSFMRTPQ